MRNLLKISHHSHSGRLRPHEHTSYAPLMFVLLVVGLILVQSTVFAATPYDGPEAGSIGLTGAVPEEPPDTAAVITSPSDQQRFSTTPITVSGTCPEGTLVEILKNNIFAGSTVCDASGEFSLEIDLLIGENELIARVYNSQNEPGPNSEPVTVFYDALPPQASSLTPLNFSTAQLILNTDTVYRGVFPNKEFNMPVEIIGGTSPFALNVRWGDSNNKIVPRDNNQPFTISHTYKKPGTYQVSLQATDAEGRVAFLTVATIVNGQPNEIAASGTGDGAKSELEAILNRIYVLWPLYVAALVAVVSFWVGEQREKQILRQHGINVDFTNTNPLSR